MRPRQPRLGVEFALLGLLALLWGSSYLWIKVAVAEIPPVTLIATRVSVAAIFLLSVVLVSGHRMPRDGATWRALFVQSLLNASVAWVLLAWGQQYVESALASVLNSTSPIFVFLFTVLVTRHERTGGLRLAGALLGFAGVVLIVGVDALAGLGLSVAGQIAALLSAMLYALAAIWGRRFAALPAPVTAAGTMLCGSAMLIPASLMVDAPWTLAPTPRAVGAALALSVLSTACAMLIYFRLVHTLGSLGVASQAYLRAGVGVMLGVVLLGEHITPVIGAGLAAAILGVALINLPARKPRDP